MAETKKLSTWSMTRPREARYMSGESTSWHKERKKERKTKRKREREGGEEYGLEGK